MTNEWHDVKDKPHPYTKIILTDGLEEIESYYVYWFTIGGFRANIEKYNKWRYAHEINNIKESNGRN